MRSARGSYIKGHDSFTWSVGPMPMLSCHFPNMTKARARLRQAEAQGDALLAAFDGKVVTALKEVEQGLVNFSAEQDRLNALRRARKRAAEAYRIADLRYRAGSASCLETLTAQSDLLTARSACAASVQRLSSARIDLFKALGGGWQDADLTEKQTNEQSGMRISTK